MTFIWFVKLLYGWENALERSGKAERCGERIGVFRTVLDSKVGHVRLCVWANLWQKETMDNCFGVGCIEMWPETSSFLLVDWFNTIRRHFADLELVHLQSDDHAFLAFPR